MDHYDFMMSAITLIFGFSIFAVVFGISYTVLPTEAGTCSPMDPMFDPEEKSFSEIKQEWKKAK